MMSGVELVKIKSVDDGMRLNRWFMKYYPKLSLGHLQKLLRTKQIKVDGKKVETSYKLATGEEMRVPPLHLDDLEERKDNVISKKDAEFIISMVIYKDSNILVLNKPSGIAVQGGTNTSFHIDGMLEALEFELEEKPKLVHRIDKDTSGLLVLARNRTYADLLTSAFRDHQLPKTYLALVKGAPKQKSGKIDAPLEKSGEKVVINQDGKSAITTYEVLDELGDKFALLAASPLTGRTHQIRAHLESIGVPIVGDDKYFGRERQRFTNLSDKLHLHAYKIDLSALYNKPMVISAPLPQHFRQSLDSLGLQFRE